MGGRSRGGGVKIAVLSTFVPFYRGGAEILADAVTAQLGEAGHEARQFRLPFAWTPAHRVLEAQLAFRMLDLSAYDRVVAFKFPAYCVEHDAKAVWLFHQFRQAYDLWDTPFHGMGEGDEAQRVRKAVIAGDQRYLVPCPRLYCNSEVTAERLERFNGRTAEVLYAPLVNPAIFRSGPFGNTIFCPSRISPGKRQALLIEAIARTRPPLRLVLAGQPETGADLDGLLRRVEALGLRDRVQIEPRFISEEEKAARMAEALAVAYIPWDEDSYGYVTLEAYASGRPVLTCSDSGGTLKLVSHLESGYVAEPNAASIAEGFEHFAARRAVLRAYAEAGRLRAQALGIGWDRVLARLLA